MPRFSVIPAAYVYLMRDRRVLLQLRRNTGYMDGRWVAGAAGHIELGETAATTAIREGREELGVRLTAGDLQPATIMQRTDGTDAPTEQRVDWFFTATSWVGTPTVMEPSKCAAIAWFDLSDLPAAVPDYERQVLQSLATGALDPFTTFGF